MFISLYNIWKYYFMLNFSLMILVIYMHIQYVSLIISRIWGIHFELVILTCKLNAHTIKLVIFYWLVCVCELSSYI